MGRDATLERFFTALISGERADARAIVDSLIEQDCSGEAIAEQLLWPVLEQIQKLYRHDQLSDLAHHYATRLLRSIADQMQMRYEQSPRREQTALVMCGPEESEEIGAQITADLLEASGFDVYFTGGGVANDEVVNQLAALRADTLVVFGAVPTTVPFTRLLIDRLHEIGACPTLQIVVGGGVFNRAEGLAEEIGADLWAATPLELIQAINDHPDQRMSPSQRTVGRKQRTRKNAA